MFLPAAGYRYGTDVYVVGDDGRYWSSSAYGSYEINAYYVYFGEYFVSPDGYSGRGSGQSVRLVCE